MEPKHLFYGAHGILASVPLVTRSIAVPVPVQACLHTSAILYIGSHASLTIAKEIISRKDAIMSPFYTSVLLLGVFLAMKCLSTYWVNLLIAASMATIGTFAVYSSLMHVLEAPMSRSKAFSAYSWERRLAFGFPVNLMCDSANLNLSSGRLLVFTASLSASLAWFFFGSWSFHNVIATCFAIQAVQTISVKDFRVSSLLLGGLFLYDIFWVFGTNVMVTVAQNIEAPIKIIFPTSVDSSEPSMLGLGDIVLPGLFVAMALRYDYQQHRKKHGHAPGKATCMNERFRKSFFWTAMTFYHLGLLTTFVFMYYFARAQPALLYLVPACFLALLWEGLVRKRWKTLLEYTEEEACDCEESSTLASESNTPTPAVATE